MKDKLNHAIEYLRDQEIDIRIRMLFLLEYAAFGACIIATATMMVIATSFVMLIPNIIVFIFGIMALYLSHKRKMYDFASYLLILGCAGLALPVMFFTAGGNESGMPIWFIFGVLFTCMMSKGLARIFLTALVIIDDAMCMVIAHLKPELVVPLKGENAGFYDAFQSFVIVCVIVCISLIVYLTTYDSQRKMLLEQREELRRMMKTDAMTGVYNRRAFYDESNEYKDQEVYVKNLVVVAMDVNGLKKVNDTQGHIAGDEMIQCASKIICKAFGEYGNVFRTGGDEFMALLSCDDDVSHKLYDNLQQSIKKSTNVWAKNMAIATGVAIWNENSDLKFEELEKLADSRMYKDKTEY